MIKKLKSFLFNCKEIMQGKIFAERPAGSFDYDAHLYLFVTLDCNLNCPYCGLKKKNDSGFAGAINPDFIETINKTNRIFSFNITGGEPFLVPNLTDVLEKITERHFITINTNLTSDNVKIFADKIDRKKVKYILGSLHIKELERHSLIENYINNYILLKNKGFRIDSKEVAYPALLNEVENYRRFFSERGVEISFMPFNGQYNGKMYPFEYTKHEKKVFGIDNVPIIKIAKRKGKICNAGYNAAFCWENGDITPCHTRNAQTIGNVYSGFKFKNNLMKCPYEICGCPIWCNEYHLYRKAIKKISAKELFKLITPARLIAKPKN